MQHFSNEMVKLGRNVRRMRTALGFTQTQLANSANIHPRYAQKIERGKGNATLCLLLGLKRALKCQWKDFFIDIQ